VYGFSLPRRAGRVVLEARVAGGVERRLLSVR
jgi:hypothetical protein